MLLFDLLQLPDQRVVFGVADLRLVQNVVLVLVMPDGCRGVLLRESLGRLRRALRTFRYNLYRRVGLLRLALKLSLNSLHRIGIIYNPFAGGLKGRNTRAWTTPSNSSAKRATRSNCMRLRARTGRANWRARP